MPTTPPPTLARPFARATHAAWAMALLSTVFTATSCARETGAPDRPITNIDADAGASRAFLGAGSPARSGAATTEAPAAVLWQGEGRVRVLEPRNPARRMAARALVPFASSIDATLRLRSELSFSVADCDGGSPFYHPATQTIVVCEDAMEAVDALFASRKAAGELSTGARSFILLHEVGHALIHLQQLPVVGREEDAADQFAVHRTLQNDRAGVASVLAAAEFFGAVSDRSGFLSDQEAAGEHATPRQRMFNLRCWAYGATPSRMEWLVGDGLLPESRAVRWPTEDGTLHRSWNLLLRDTVR